MPDRQIIIEGLIQLHLSGEGGEKAVASMKNILDQSKQIEKSMGGYSQGIHKAGDEIEIFEEKLKSVGERLAAIFAIEKVAEFIKGSLLGFAALERQVGNIQARLESIGQGSKGSGLKAFVEELANVTGVLDDQLYPAFRRALTVFHDFDVAAEIVTMAAKFQAQGVNDVGANVEGMARFFQTGMARGLIPFGIHIKEGEQKVLQFSEGLAMLKAQLAGGKQTFEDAQADVDHLAIAWDRLEKSTGNALYNYVQYLKRMAAGAVVLHDMLAKTGEFSDFKEENAARDRAAKDFADEMKRQTQEEGGRRARTAAEKYAEEQDKERKDKEARLAAEETAKREAELQNQISSIEEKAGEDRLRSQIDRTEKGSEQRIALELKLNDILAEHAEREAERTFAKSKIRTEKQEQALADIREHFAAKASAIRATRGETEDERKARTGVVGDLKFTPGNELETMKLIEEFERHHQDELTRIQDEATVARLQGLRDLTLEGTQERFDAEAKLQIAELKLQTNREIAAAKGQQDLITEIQKQAAAKRKGIEGADDKVRAEARRAEILQITQNYAEAGAALLRMFGKNKAAALGLLVVNTATAVMNAWAHASSWEEGLAETIAIGLLAEEQRRRIMSANPSGGGGGVGTGTAATPPSFAASGGNSGAASSGSSGTFVAPMSQSQFEAMAGRRSSGGGGGTIVNIGHAFGDHRSMIKLSRQITRVLENDPSRIR